jgi:hypothetical protein
VLAPQRFAVVMRRFDEILCWGRFGHFS